MKIKFKVAKVFDIEVDNKFDCLVVGHSSETFSDETKENLTAELYAEIQKQTSYKSILEDKGNPTKNFSVWDIWNEVFEPIAEY